MNTPIFLALFAFFASISLVACGGSSTASSAPAKAQVTPKSTRIIDRDNGYLYYTTPQGIYQIHADTGHPGWKTPQGKAQIALSEGQQTLYISSNTTRQPALTALDNSTKQQKWSTPFDQITTFLVHGNSIYVASLGTLYRVDATTGNFNLSTGARKYKVTSANPNSGASLWQWSIPASYPPNEIYASDLYALVSNK